MSYCHHCGGYHEMDSTGACVTTGTNLPCPAIAVPDIPGPKVQLCWAQGPLMVRCDRVAGHAGPHVWELAVELAAYHRFYGDGLREELDAKEQV